MDLKTIIILIIVFNVVTAIVKKRAKKAQQQQGADGNAGVDDEQEYEHEEAPEAPHQVVHGGTVSEEGFDDEETVYSRQSYKAPIKLQPQSAPVEKKPELSKAASVGKDLLGQLAKELGLQLPETPKPTPKPTPAITAVAKPEIVSKSVPKWIRQDDFEEPTLIKASEDLPKAGGARKRNPQFSALVKDSQALQNAFVLKEIIDPPLALRRK